MNQSETVYQAEYRNKKNMLDESELGLDQAERLMKQFVKSVKTCGIYPENNPVYQQSLNALEKAFFDYFVMLKEFRLRVEKYSLHFNDTTLFEAPESDDNFAFLFFNDGIQWMIFRSGLDEDELRSIVQIICTARAHGLEQYDIVTAIWERKLPHIEFIASDEMLFQSFEEVSTDVDDIKENIVRFKIGRKKWAIEDLEAPGEGGTEEEGSGRGSLAKEEEEETPEEKPSLTVLTDDASVKPTSVDKQYLADLVEREKNRDLNGIMVELIVETLWNETDPGTCPHLVKALEHQFEECFAFAKAEPLKAILRDMKKMLVACEEDQPWKVALLHEMAGRIGDDKFLSKNDVHIVEFDQNALKEVLTMLARMRRDNVPPLCRILGWTENRTYRRILCDTLIEMGTEVVPEVARFLHDKRWFLVRNILLILGKIGGEQAQSAIMRKLGHGDKRVRREAVNALFQDENFDATGLLTLLDDEEKAIRTTILSALIKTRASSPIAGELRDRIQDREFAKKNQEEINLFFEALAVCGAGDHALVSFLKPLLLKKRLFGRSRYDKLRWGSALALKRLGTEDAIAALKTGEQSGPGSAQMACREALQSK